MLSARSVPKNDNTRSSSSLGSQTEKTSRSTVSQHTRSYFGLVLEPTVCGMSSLHGPLHATCCTCHKAWVYRIHLHTPPWKKLSSFHLSAMVYSKTHHPLLGTVHGHHLVKLRRLRPYRPSHTCNRAMLELHILELQLWPPGHTPGYRFAISLGLTSSAKTFNLT